MYYLLRLEVSSFINHNGYTSKLELVVKCLMNLPVLCRIKSLDADWVKWENEVSVVLRYIIVFIIGFLLTFIMSFDFFNQYNVMLNLLFRIIFALFFLLIIWLLQKNDKRSGKWRMERLALFKILNGKSDYSLFGS
mgnify:CR=1 FL=1